MPFDFPTFQLVRTRLLALASREDCPPQTADLANDLMIEAEFHIKAATSLYRRAQELHEQGDPATETHQKVRYLA